MARRGIRCGRESALVRARAAAGERGKPQALREDRILAEVHATRGDARRVSDLFGLGIESSNRYLDTLEHGDLAAAREDVPGTSSPG
ncbi:hypothetical protein [Streptomyces sp. NBC_00063]|uniref:hypothetical protein n=1 Tax=Streptomyces sp. NBC_00063 TaxID=2975638 RepID=UPI0022541061|nr:hypothetical protein [Streptomyces sp. NBC_00063]MCX5435549.1 hypothetical protein [Streptomyces sp. NBC_00063]